MSDLSSDTTGALLLELPRTLSLKNWPFLVMLVFLATVLSIPLYLAGNWLGIALIFAAIASAPLLIGVLIYVFELLGRPRLDGVYERGIVWRRAWMTGFLAWSDLAKLERIVDDEDNVNWRIIARPTGVLPVYVSDSMNTVQARELIEKHLVP